MTTAAVKEALPNIRDYLPTDDTSAAIRAAFFRLSSAKQANASALAEMEVGRPAALMAGQIEKHDATISKRRVFAEQCAVAETELRQSFTVAKEGEEDAEYRAKLAELRATESAWTADTLERYPALAAGLVDLLTREAELLRGYIELGRMPGAARSRIDLGATLDHPSGTMLRGFIAANHVAGTLGEFSRLPALVPGPALWGGRR